MSFDHLMQSFARQQQLGELEIRDSRYYFTIDSQMEIACFQANGKFYVYGVVAMVPGDSRKRETFLVDLLQKNLALIMTERVSLCVEPDDDRLALYLCRSLQGLDEASVEQSVAILVNNLELFIRLSSSGSSPESPSPSILMP